MGVSWKHKCRRRLICIANSKEHPVLVKHVKKCRTPNCIACTVFEILGSAKLPPWARRCPDDESSVSWIEYCWPDPSSTSSFQLRCSLCESGGWSKFSTYSCCSTYHLKRHASSFHHMMILSKSLGHAKALAVVKGKVVPDKLAFLKLLQGNSSAKFWRRKKLRRCCAEAARRLNLSRLLQSQSISIRQDVGHSWLAVRFVACDGNLQVSSGLLGAVDISKYVDLTAASISEALLEIYKQASTKFLNFPDANRVSDLDAQARMQVNTELYVSDAAKDEVLVGKNLKRNRIDVHDPKQQDLASSEMFPGMKHRLNDRSHAMRRLTKRSWSDDYLKDTHKIFVTAAYSPSQMLRHSKALRELFNDYRRECGTLKRVKLRRSLRKTCDMNSALHRFDTESKPAARVVWYFKPLCRSMSKIGKARKGLKQGKRAAQWMARVDSERCLQLAMMCDGADESIRILRAFEPELFDESTLRPLITSYNNRLRALFFDELCWQSGFTKVMVNTLHQDCFLECPDSAAKILGKPGGPSGWNDIKERCLRRMQLQVLQIETICEAEFPHFSVTQSFTVFNLQHIVDERTDLKQLRTLDPSSTLFQDLERLAQYFQPLASNLLHEYCELLPLALAYFREGYTVKNAWQRALTQASKSRRLKKRYIALRHVLARWQCWGGSTGGVERLFALWMHSSVWKTVLNEPNTLDVLMLLGADKEDHEKIAELAQQVWSEVFSNSLGEYTVMGIQKKRAALVDTQKAFIASRRRVLQRFVDSGAPRQIVDKTIMSGPMWTKECQAEHEFNLAKQAQNIKEAFEENALLPHEVYAGLEDDVARLQEVEHRADVTREKRNAKMRLQRSSSRLLHFAGKNAFVSPECQFDQKLLDRRFLCWEMTQTQFLIDAHVYVSPSASCTSPDVRLVVALQGGVIMNSTCFKYGSKHDGAAVVAYLPSISLQRWIYMSEAFVAAERRKASIIFNVLKETGIKKKWKFVTLPELRRRAAKSQTQALAFVTDLERRTVGDLATVQNKLLGDEIAVFLERQDWASSLPAQ